MARRTGDLVRSDLLIVGGGLTGLALGLAVAQAGIPATIVERTPLALNAKPARDGRVLALALSSKRMLEALGLWPALALEAEPILEIRVVDGESPLFLHYDHREVGDEPLGFMVEISRLRAALIARVLAEPSLRVFAPARLAELERRPSGVAARLADGTRIAARLIAACDGRRSELRREAGIETLEWSYRQTAIVCTIAHERAHGGVAVEKFLPPGPFAVLPMTHHRSSIVWTEDERTAPALLGLDRESFHSELGSRLGDYLGAFALEGSPFSYPLVLCQALRYTDVRLVLVGDAAHTIHPLAGQGFNLGLRGVAALAEVLAEAARLGLDIGTADWLERYAAWRRFDALVLGAVTDGMNRLFSNALPPLKLARDLGLAAVHRMPPLKRVFMRHAMGVMGDLPRLMAGRPL
ncbi:MAG TPA: UbiH/UbiF/VisC/COQ6 family ubiquinone biosynthesis hydroxylase [Alphaproteobacteria bacterium]|nr:UbiH/UbiF/VisC/COQ6 family ubiquinone biosynthesis hydroxylase [Alphaproteobacteria bacterium]